MAEIRRDIHMEVLSVKFGILAGLFGVIGLIGLAALLGSIIFLIIRVANFDSMLPALLCVVLSLALAVGGMFLTPPPEIAHMEPLKAPWTMAMEQIVRFWPRPIVRKTRPRIGSLIPLCLPGSGPQAGRRARTESP